MISTSAAARSFSGAALLAVAASLLSCGGGGGSGAGGSPIGRPASTSSRPCAAGDAFAFAGSALQTIQRPLPPPSPAPPSPQPTATSLLTVQQTVNVVSTGAAFGGRTGLADFRILETDAQPLQTITSLTDEFFACPAGAGNDVEVGWTSNDSNGVALTLTYGAGNGLVDQLPETAGASWTNTAALALSEIDADFQQTHKTVNPDGSYTENVQFPDGTTSDAAENSDGSATYSAPLGGPNAGGNTVITIGTPAPGSGGMRIPITFTSPGSPPEVDSVADWYPAGALRLASETDQNLGAGAIPGSCGATAANGAIANQLVQNRTRLDTLFGEIESEVTTTYTVAGLGVVCVVVADTLTAYYDYTGQGIFFAEVPQQITSLNETIGLKNATVLRSAVRASNSVARSTFELAQARFWRAVRARHARQLQGLRRRLAGGGLIRRTRLP
jgi:hypothetical protein